MEWSRLERCLQEVWKVWRDSIGSHLGEHAGCECGIAAVAGGVITQLPQQNGQDAAGKGTHVTA